MNDSSTSSSGVRLASVILIVLAAVGVVLGIVGLYSTSSSRKAVEEVQARVESELSGVAGLAADVQTLNSRAQNAFGQLAREVSSLREQYSNSMARVVSAPAKEAGSKDEKVVQPLDPNGVYHTIQPGDLLGRVASKYGTSVDEILRLNPGLDPKRVRLGQKVRVR